jgi:hypothetical protein
MGSRRVSGARLVGRNAFAAIDYPIEGNQIRIGSGAGNDLILPHQSVSARHAELRQKRNSYVVRDLGSANGTFVNGKRIDGELTLRPGDEVRFGAARFAMMGASRSPVLKYVASAFGLMLVAAAAYLAFDFVTDWENLEKLSSSAPVAAPSIASNVAAPPVALKTPEHAVPDAAVAEVKPAAAVASSASPPWLVAINQYRASVNLPPVTEDPKLSEGDRKHAIYVVKNYEDKVGGGHLIGGQMHDEENGNPWYSPAGAQAGAQSDVNQLWGPDKMPSPTWALNHWFDGPFHRLWILNPNLHRVGYGEFCEKQYCVAALDLGSGAKQPNGAEPLAKPLEFPADKSTITRNSFSVEWPTPLTSCAGYAFPAGYAETIQLGALIAAKLSEYQITRDGHGVESCGIDATNYQNPVSGDQERGRAILSELGAAIIVPRYPLKPGHYSVTATVNDHAYQWSFTVAAAPAETPWNGASHATAPARSTASGTASKPSAKDDLEATIRAGYARIVKGDRAGRDEYGVDPKQK